MGKVHIKSTLRICVIPVRIDAGKDERKETFYSFISDGYLNVSTTIGIHVAAPQKAKNQCTSIYSCITLGVSPKDADPSRSDYCSSMFAEALVIIGRNWKKSFSNGKTIN